MSLEKLTFTSKDGGLFLQQSPSTNPEWFGCYTLDDIASDLGDVELIFCFDVNGKYRAKAWTEGAPSPITTTLTGDLGKASEYFERVKLPFYLHINMRSGGVANEINNYDRAVILEVIKITNRTLSNLVTRDEDTRSEQSFDLSVMPFIMDVYRLTADRQTTTEPRGINDVFFMSGEQYGGAAGPGFTEGQYGIASTDGFTGITADVLFTYDGGDNWSLAAADPFAVVENIGPCVGFWIGKNRWRWLVGRASTDAGNPAEVAYTDFNLETDTAAGASWTLANVGSTNAQFFSDRKSLYAADRFNIWAAMSGGYVYKSTDGGATWAAQESGILTTQNLNCIGVDPNNPKSILYVGGAANALLRTLDGGVTWSLVSGPSAQSAANIITIAVRDRYRVFLGYSDGEIWYTSNGGLTWTQISGLPVASIATVRDIQFINDMQGFALVNTSAPVGTLIVTRDGGRSWEGVTTPTNAGINALSAVRNNVVFAVGEVQSATGLILKTAG